MKKIAIIAAGSPHAGGTSFDRLIREVNHGHVSAKICAVLTVHQHGGVMFHARQHNIPCTVISAMSSKNELYNVYTEFVVTHNPDVIVVLGWCLPVIGIGSIPVVAVHHGPLPHTAGLCGDDIHKKVEDLRIKATSFTVHLVRPDGSTGLRLYTSRELPIKPRTHAKDIGTMIREYAATIFPRILELFIQGHIVTKDSLVRYDGYGQTVLKKIEEL